MDLRKLVGVSAVMLAVTSVSCSQSSDIPLRGPAAPTAPPPPADPVTPSNSDTSNSDTSEPSTPTIPTPPPSTVPSAPAVKTYRLFCDDRYPPHVTSVSSLASPSGFGAGLQLGEATAGGKFNPVTNHNLESHLHPQVVSLSKDGFARVLFSAQRMRASQRFVFIADAEIAARGGVARKIASEVQIPLVTQNAAAKENVALRSFGVSDQGRYLLIGHGGGYNILDATSLRLLGNVATGSAGSNFNPQLREADMILSVSSIAGGSFTTKLYSLAMGSGRISRSSLVATASGLRRPLVSIAPSAGESYAALTGGARMALVSPLRSATHYISIAGLPRQGRLSSAAAFWREGADLRAGIVFENFVPLSGAGLARYKIEQVFVRVLDVNESTLSSQTITDEVYPPEAAQRVADGFGTISGGQPGVSDFKTSPDGQAIFALFPGELAKQIYRLTAAGFERVSQESCMNLSIGVEP